VRARVNGETSVNEIIEIESFDGIRNIIQNTPKVSVTVTARTESAKVFP
jgi:hypothetical protein